MEAKDNFCGLSDDDLESLRDTWMFLSDERGNCGTRIIDELLHLRRYNYDGVHLASDFMVESIEE